MGGGLESHCIGRVYGADGWCHETGFVKLGIHVELRIYQ